MQSIPLLLSICNPVAEQLQCSCSAVNYVARTLSQKLYELKDRIQNAVVSRVVEDFIDISTPLKQFTDAVHVPQGQLSVVQTFNPFTSQQDLVALTSHCTGFMSESVQRQSRFICSSSAPVNSENKPHECVIYCVNGDEFNLDAYCFCQERNVCNFANFENELT